MQEPIETLLVVDDVPENIGILAAILRPRYRVTFAQNGDDALVGAQAVPQPDLILLDVAMPQMDGYEVCRRLKADLRTAHIPIIFITAHSDQHYEEQGLSLGAVDYLHKPCHPSIVLQRVRIHLDLHNQSRVLDAKVRERTRELEDTRIEIVRRLGRAGEYRDNETGMHVIRMSQFCHRLALAAGIAPAAAELLQLAAPMHDIGKIGIPDSVLLKPGQLDDAERALMQTHAQIGADILGQHETGLLAMAHTVALTHHERWDGQGYPRGLAGEAIPLEGRIAAIADVYDALRSSRPYKLAWSPEQAAQYIVGQAGQAFDPSLVPLFADLVSDYEGIRAEFSDDADDFDDPN
jgi:putative two-component system response regulator